MAIDSTYEKGGKRIGSSGGARGGMHAFRQGILKTGADDLLLSEIKVRDTSFNQRGFAQEYEKGGRDGEVESWSLTDLTY